MRSGKPRQVKVRAASAAEHERWRAEAKRRKWPLNTLIRVAVNREVMNNQGDEYLVAPFGEK